MSVSELDNFFTPFVDVFAIIELHDDTDDMELEGDAGGFVNFFPPPVKSKELNF